MLHNTIVNGGSGGSSGYPVIYALDAPVVANADFYEDTGLTFGSSSANGVAKAWTIMGDFWTVATYVTAFAVNVSSSNILTLYYNGNSDPQAYFCTNNWSPITTHESIRCRVVITHEAGATTQVTYHALSNGEVATADAAKSYGHLAYESFAGNLCLGGQTAANFVGKINAFTIYEGVVDSETIEDFLLAEEPNNEDISLIDVLNRNVYGTVSLNITGQPTPTTSTGDSRYYNAGFNGLFQDVKTITSLTISGLKWVPSQIMRNDSSGNNSALISVSFPDALFAGARAFQNNRKLTTASFPSLIYGYSNYTQLTHYMFSECVALTTVDLGNLDDLSSYTFYQCISLASLELNAVTNIRDNAFHSCSSLATLVIRSSAVPTLANISAFTNTPFASGKAGGTLYVPSDLISSYQAATNWSTILGYSTNSIVAIEGSAYE